MPTGKPKSGRRSDCLIISDSQIKEVERMAAIGMTGLQIAQILGISYETLIRRRRENPSLREALRLGREKGKLAVNETAYQMAKSGKCWQMTYRWLRHRDPDHWRDPPQDITVNVHPALQGPDGRPLKGRALVEKVKAQIADYEESLPKELEEGEIIDADSE